jgi:ATP-dependent DNA helicase RecG
MSEFVETQIEFLKGVGPAKAQALQQELGIFTIADLLSHYPFRHEDRSKVLPIREVMNYPDVYIQLKGKIARGELIGRGPGTRYSAMLKDDTGQIELVWFQGAKWIEKYIDNSKEYLIYGKASKFRDQWNIAHPELQIVDSDFQLSKLGLVPVYPLTEGLKRKKIENKLLVKLSKQVVEDPRFKIQDNLPDRILKKYHFPQKADALRMLHAPKNSQELEQAKQRLKYEELFYLQLRYLQLKGNRNRTYKGIVFDRVGEYFMGYYEKYLPFDLTNAQKRVLKEIRADLKRGLQMNRLLQGDVGSGKTMVAQLSMLMAIDNGYQACLMAPTEILAQQHGAGIAEDLKPLGLKVRLLTGSTPKKQRTEILDELKKGNVDILIGTHALIEDEVIFKSLGLVVIDEQHRFGVAQRARLWKKGNVLPHILVMTATPIPRTLAMTLYGDLDVSVIDELPKGRKPIKTVHRHESNRPLVMEFLKQEIAKGRQVYYVFPLIEDSPKLALKSLMSGYEMVTDYLPTPTFTYSLLHGKMKPAEKEAEMEKFKTGKTQIMVATTVIEVGVNVPNASVMVIENTERFGLSQLHQLRGRVGRGAEQSYCILISGSKLSEAGKTRIKTMVRTTDGFEIAKVDLDLRGPGEMDGTRQSGILDLRLSDIRKDESILIASRADAQTWLEEDELLTSEASKPIRYELSKTPNRTIWSKIS